MSIIDVQNVRKTYPGGIDALDGVSLDIEEGATYGLLGTNGAGKSTLLKMLVGHLAPDSGMIEVAGTDVVDSGTNIRQQVGFLPENVGFPASLTGREALSFHAKMRGISDEHRIDEVLDTVGISEAADRAIAGYSNGMQRRLGLATALLPQPRILLLDEPTAGLDPLGVATFHDIIQSLHETANLTVVITSHVMGEVEKLCDTVAIMHQGRVRAAGGMTKLLDAIGDIVTVTFTIEKSEDIDPVTKIVEEFATDMTQPDERTFRVSIPHKRLPEFFVTLYGDIPIERYQIQENSLETIFRKVIQETENNTSDQTATTTTEQNDGSGPMRANEGTEEGAQ